MRSNKGTGTTCVCVICSRSFAKVKNTTGLYCSRKCAWEARGGVEHNARVARESAEQRGDAQRGRGEGRTYRKRNGRHEHRVVVEQKIGRVLRPGEVVHHIDGDKLNNDPDNLAVMTQAEHMRKHDLWKARWPSAV